jgi:hypothetical protein
VPPPDFYPGGASQGRRRGEVRCEEVRWPVPCSTCLSATARPTVQEERIVRPAGAAAGPRHGPRRVVGPSVSVPLRNRRASSGSGVGGFEVASQDRGDRAGGGFRVVAKAGRQAWLSQQVAKPCASDQAATRPSSANWWAGAARRSRASGQMSSANRVPPLPLPLGGVDPGCQRGTTGYSAVVSAGRRQSAVGGEPVDWPCFVSVPNRIIRMERARGRGLSAVGGRRHKPHRNCRSNSMPPSAAKG